MMKLPTFMMIGNYLTHSENVNGKLRTYLAVSRGISNFQCFRKRVIYSLSKDVQYSQNNSVHCDSVPKRKRGTYKKIRD